MAAVEGTLSFFERGSWPSSERPYEMLFESPVKTLPTCNFKVTEVSNIPIHDMRPLKGELSLDREGFMVADIDTSMTYEDYFNETKLRTTFMEELKTVLKDLLGAKAAYVHECVIRRQSSSASKSEGFGEPIPNAHTDYTHEFAVDLVRRLVGDKADAIKQSRKQMLNLWKPLRGPLRSWPLALCDLKTLDRQDIVTLDEVHAAAVLESQQILYSPTQKWYYLSNQQPTELLIFKSMDTAVRGEVAHASFCDPNCPAAEPPRESIECRVLVVYG